jgi:F-type H+-transporting ATPase subunit gamma
MANLKDIKRRINSVKSTQKITNAMKLVSAAKFSRANHAVEGSRPYADGLSRMVSHLVATAGEQLQSPYLEERDEKKVLLVVLATDRGLCGGLNSNLFKTCQEFFAEKKHEGVEVDLFSCGRRAISFAKKTSQTQIEQQEKVIESPKYEDAQDLAGKLATWFVEQRYDAIFVAYPSFVTALEQTPKIERLLPLSFDEFTGDAEDVGAEGNLLVEPQLSQFLEHLLRRQLDGSVFRMMLNGSASEHGARMTAMDAATNNAKEVIRKLTLQYNRARQAAITTELTEIISGVEALN